MMPGMSASVKRRSRSGSSTTPRIGERVVNGYAAMAGLALLNAFSRLDLPALG